MSEVTYTVVTSKTNINFEYEKNIKRPVNCKIYLGRTVTNRLAPLYVISIGAANRLLLNPLTCMSAPQNDSGMMSITIFGFAVW